jgi:hypothetical protein
MMVGGHAQLRSKNRPTIEVWIDQTERRTWFLFENIEQR